MTFSDL